MATSCRQDHDRGRPRRTITTTSSMVAKYGQPSGVGYPTSKFAVNGMVQSLSRELAPMGIRVNAVAPGVTKTDMVANLPEEVINPSSPPFRWVAWASPRMSPTPLFSWRATCPPTSRAPCSPSTEPPAPKEPQALASSFNIAQPKRRASESTADSAPSPVMKGKLCPSISDQNGARFPPGPPCGNCIPL